MATTTPEVVLSLTRLHGGIYRCTPEDFDLVMERYLPNSIATLRDMLTKRTEVDYSDLHSVTELLMIFGDIDRPVSGYDWG